MNREQKKEEERKIRDNTTISGLFVLLIFLFISFGFAAEQNSRESGLSIGDTINYFDLVGVEGEIISCSNLKDNESALISAIFIHSPPCHICQKNKEFWNRIYTLTHEKINIYGIIFDDITKVRELSNAKQFKYKLFCPQDFSRFKKSLKISRSENTILTSNSKVIYIKKGILEMDDYFTIIKFIQGEKK